MWAKVNLHIPVEIILFIIYNTINNTRINSEFYILTTTVYLLLPTPVFEVLRTM